MMTTTRKRRVFSLSVSDLSDVQSGCFVALVRMLDLHDSLSPVLGSGPRKAFPALGANGDARGVKHAWIARERTWSAGNS